MNDVWAIWNGEAWVCGIGGYALQGGHPGTLRHTTDGGRTWHNEHPGTNALRKLFFLDARHGWVAGGAGGGRGGGKPDAAYPAVNAGCAIAMFSTWKDVP